MQPNENINIFFDANLLPVLLALLIRTLYLRHYRERLLKKYKNTPKYTAAKVMISTKRLAMVTFITAIMTIKTYFDGRYIVHTYGMSVAEDLWFIINAAIIMDIIIAAVIYSNFKKRDMVIKL